MLAEDTTGKGGNPPAPLPAMEPKALSDRAKLRLRIAANLLRGAGMKFDCPRDAFYETIQKVLSDLPPERQEQLRGHVDFVEAMERAELAEPGFLPKTKKPAR